MTGKTIARMMAGIPTHNMAMYHRLRFLVGDPAVFIETTTDGVQQTLMILRDIEMERAAEHARVDRVACPKDFEPEGGLSGDRETATAQAAAESLRRSGVEQVTVDRSLPAIYATMLERAGMHLTCDFDWGVVQRRTKDEQEVAWLREAQSVTENIMQRACETVGQSTADGQGLLQHDGEPLTSPRLQTLIDIWLMELGYSNPGSIVAGGPEGADCHNRGHEALRTGQPVIIDIFPQNRQTLYNGDCTRTAVHGEISDELRRMHETVVNAKAAGCAAVRTGVTGESVHQATIDVILAAGYNVGLPKPTDPDTYTAMVHGTGHGIGLEVHEPPLLDFGGPELVAGDALTVEPGLYSKAIGGIRVEDMVVTTDSGHENLNQMSEDLHWG